MKLATSLLFAGAAVLPAAAAQERAQLGRGLRFSFGSSFFDRFSGSTATTSSSDESKPTTAPAPPRSDSGFDLATFDVDRFVTDDDDAADDEVSGFVRETGTIGSSVECTAVASAQSISTAENAHATAIAEAIAEGCNGAVDIEDFVPAFTNSATGGAIAQVRPQPSSRLHPL